MSNPEEKICSITMMGAGGIRSSLQKGDITYGGVLTVFPFEGTMDKVFISGATILSALEHSVRRYVENADDNPGEFLQVAGIHVTYDMTMPPQERVKDVKIRCQDCDIPVFEDLKMDQDYCVLMTEFTADGGDGFAMIPQGTKLREPLGGDLEIMLDQISRMSPVYYDVQGRIKIIEENVSGDEGSSAYLLKPLISSYFLLLLLK